MANHQFHRDQLRAKWTAASTKIFADLLVEQIQQGNRSNNIFSKKAWKYIQDEFNKQTSLKFDRQQLKNHLDVLRKRYNHVKALLERAGFSWDDANCMVVAEGDVWLKHIEAHPAAEPIKRNGCPIYNQLCIIFNESGSDDKCALSDSVKAMHEVVQEQSRARWTTSLEKVFIDLMLEQVLQGNRSNNTYSKKAWKWISEEFIRKTGVRFEKQQLQNRQSVLRRLYSSMKWLLEQNGFSWNDTLHMVIADDEVWNSYIKAHPGADAIRGKACPIFKQLCIVFSEPDVEGRYVQSSHDTEPDRDRVEGRQVQPTHNTELDQDIISMGTPEVASISAEPIAYEGSSHSAEEGNKSDGRNKRRNVEPNSSRCVKRIHTGTNRPAKVDAKITSRIDKRVTALTHCSDKFSISNSIKLLNGIQGIDQCLYLAASDLFQDRDKRETFISIKSEFRLAWLKAKCTCLSLLL